MFKNVEKTWNFIYSVSFLSLVILFSYYINFLGISLDQLKFKDIIIIILAVYRLTRLLVYDKVLDFVRDYFVKSESQSGFVKSTRYFLTCPWCAGVWMSLIVVVLYILTPFGPFFSLILAISGVASFVHLTVSLIGWVSEERKFYVKNVKKIDTE